MATASGDDDTIIGKECHIVAQRDDPSVARAPRLLTDDEKREWAKLIEHRHAYENLMLLCGVHSDLIDDVNQQYSVAQVVDIKRAHERAVEARRRAQQAEQVRSVGHAAERERLAWPLFPDDIGAWQRKALVALRDSNPDALRWLLSEVGDPAEPGRIRTLITQWPPRLRDGHELLVVAAIREAEAVGLWAVAADAWVRLAGRYAAADRADRLTRAAIDAGVGGDPARRERLLAEAEAADPDCPRLHLERIKSDLPPAEQLIRLDEIYTDDDALSAAIACQKALASLLIPDLNSAVAFLADAEALDPGSMAVRSTAVNVRVQSARVALTEDRTFSLAEAESAQADALTLRDELITMARWEESGRLLMLASDIAAVLRDLESSEMLLRRARSEELDVPDGPHVLGDAALRVGAPKLALQFVEHAPPADATTRIRSTAEVDLGGWRRTQGLATLEKLAVSDSTEKHAAALARLVACLPPVRAPWSEPAAQVLTKSEYVDSVPKLRVLATAAAGNILEAERLAAELPDDADGAEVRLRIAGLRGQHTSMRENSKRFLEFAPDASGRLLAATALANAGELQRAGEITAAVAHDPNSPPRVRADAFALRLQALADRNRWQDADREWQAFEELSRKNLRRGDGRVSAWQVRILHHRGRQGNQP